MAQQHLNLQTPRSSGPHIVSVKIERVIDLADIPVLARICQLAVVADTFEKFHKKYAPKSMFDETVEKFTTAVSEDNKGMTAFKAVATVIDGNTGEETQKIVGCTLRYVGYLYVPKVDPFARRKSKELKIATDDKQTLSDVAVANASEVAKINEAVVEPANTKPKGNPLEEVTRISGNAYVGAIRGKRHVYLRRMFVLPEYQRQGIGKKLLQWGIDVADRERIVAWLFARPAGSKMYEAAGWKAVAVTEVNEPEFEVDPLVSMLRLPQPWDGTEPRDR